MQECNMSSTALLFAALSGFVGALAWDVYRKTRKHRDSGGSSAQHVSHMHLNGGSTRIYRID
jgi:hypothetical protein